MQLAHVGVCPAHASGTVTHVGVVVGVMTPPSGGSVPGYCPLLMQISPARQCRSPQDTPQLPALEPQVHLPALPEGDPDALHAQVWWFPAPSHESQLV